MDSRWIVALVALVLIAVIVPVNYYFVQKYYYPDPTPPATHNASGLVCADPLITGVVWNSLRKSVDILFKPLNRCAGTQLYTEVTITDSNNMTQRKSTTFNVNPGDTSVSLFMELKAGTYTINGEIGVVGINSTFTVN